MNIFQILFSLRGRMNRLPFFLYGLGTTAALVALGGGLVRAFGEKLPPAPMTVVTCAFLVYLWMRFALSAKRAHDRNHSAWYLLLAIIPFANIWIAVELLFFRGSEGSNEFGPDPLGGLSLTDRSAEGFKPFSSSP